MLTRVTLSNITPEDLAKSGQAAGLSGSVSPNIGFGDWGIEPGATVEIAHPTDQLKVVRWWVTDLLGKLGEQAAYVVVDGHPRLWTSEGTVKTIDGVPIMVAGRGTSASLPELIP